MTDLNKEKEFEQEAAAAEEAQTAEETAEAAEAQCEEECTDACDEENRLARTLLPLPLDQRYEKCDMERLLHLILG